MRATSRPRCSAPVGIDLEARAVHLPSSLSSRRLCVGLPCDQPLHLEATDNGDNVLVGSTKASSPARKPLLNTRDRPGAHLGLTKQLLPCMQRCNFLQISSAHRKVTAHEGGVVSMKQKVDDPRGEFQHVPPSAETISAIAGATCDLDVRRKGEHLETVNHLATVDPTVLHLGLEVSYNGFQCLSRCNVGYIFFFTQRPVLRLHIHAPRPKHSLERT